MQRITEEAILYDLPIIVKQVNYDFILQVSASLEQEEETSAQIQQIPGQRNVGETIVYFNLQLKAAKEQNNKGEEGNAYRNIRNAYFSLGDFKKAIEYHSLHLRISKDAGDRAEEARAYANLGTAFLNLGDFTKAVDNCNLALSIAKQVGYKIAEEVAYRNLGTILHCLGDFKKAIDYHNLHLGLAIDLGDKTQERFANACLSQALQKVGKFTKNTQDYCNPEQSIVNEDSDKTGERFASECLDKNLISYHNFHVSIAKEMGYKAEEGVAYFNLGNTFYRLRDFNMAKVNYTLCLSIAKEAGAKRREGVMYSNLGNTFLRLGEFSKAIDSYKLQLSIAKEIDDKTEEGRAYGNIGNGFHCLGDFKNAIKYHNLSVNNAKEVGDNSGEGIAYGNLGNSFYCLGDFKQAIYYHNLQLSLAKELGEQGSEANAYASLSNDFAILDSLEDSVNYHKLHLKLATEMGDKTGKGYAHCNIGNILCTQGNFGEAVDNYNLALTAIKEIGDKSGEGTVYGDLGSVFHRLGNFKKAIQYYELHLRIAKEVGDRYGEGHALTNLGSVFASDGDLRKGEEYHKLGLHVAKEVGDETLKGIALQGLGAIFETQGRLPEAEEYLQSSVRVFNKLQSRLQRKDEWKIGLRNKFKLSYTSLWKILLKQDKVEEALLAAEEGRAQALEDLMRSQYRIGEVHLGAGKQDQKDWDVLSDISSSTVFQAVDNGRMNFWILLNVEPFRFKQTVLDDPSALEDGNAFFQSLILNAYKEMGVRTGVRCEDRSLDSLKEGDSDGESYDEKCKKPFLSQESPLSTLYDIVIKPIVHLIPDNELVIVPDGPLWLAPYAALLDADFKYLCESFKIRLIPSLTSRKLITDCANGYHRKSDALLVGDPWISEIPKKRGRKRLQQLEFAKGEVEMIGKILKVTPLIRREATKEEVLKRIGSVALIHIAAHGSMDTGEIALTPNPKRTSRIPKNEDYMLTAADVLSVQLRAKLVVLSCCHSGRGEIKAEGVVGIARAFMGAGARSVLVSLWAIDDRATLEFMRSFYNHLMEGRSASESLNQAMKCLRESEKYSNVKYWASFVLIGDDVTLEFDKNQSLT